MKKKQTYINCKGTRYYFSEKIGKRGTQIVASKKESDVDLTAIPDTHEIVENPNGQVSCRKKVKSAITSEEASYVESICSSMVDPDMRLFVEIKKNALIVHVKEISDLNQLVDRLPGNRAENLILLAENVPFESVLKFELVNKETRMFAVFRMCWIDVSGEWIFLKEGNLYVLVEEFGPHIGQESFYELF